MAVSTIGEVGLSDRQGQQPDTEPSKHAEYLHLSLVLHVFQSDECRVWKRLTQHEQREDIFRDCYADWRLVEAFVLVFDTSSVLKHTTNKRLW